MFLWILTTIYNRVCHNLQRWYAVIFCPFGSSTRLFDKEMTPEVWESLFAEFDSYPIDDIKRAWNNEMAALPPQMAYREIPPQQKVFRQWMCRFVHRKTLESSSSKKRALLAQKPAWHFYEIHRDGQRLPARVLSLVENGRLCIVTRPFKTIQFEQVAPQDLHIVSEWNEQHMRLIKSNLSSAGIFMDPLGVMAVKLGALKLKQKQKRNLYVHH